MERKYKLTDECIQHEGHKLYRIKALRSFADVKEGDLGGYIESEDNISHDGTCWVYGKAEVLGDAKVCGNAKVYGKAEVLGDAEVRGDAEVYGNAKVYGKAEVLGDAKVCGNAKVYGNACVYGDAEVCGNAKVYGKAEVLGDAKVCGKAEVRGDAEVFGNAEVRGDAEVYKNGDYIVFKNWWSSGRYFTWTRSNNKWKVGCFWGTGAELINKAYEDSELSGREYERVVKYVESILADENAKKKIKAIMTTEDLEERELLIDLIRRIEYGINGAKKLLKFGRAKGFEDTELVAALDKDLEKLPKQKKLLETYLEKL